MPQLYAALSHCCVNSFNRTQKGKLSLCLCKYKVVIIKHNTNASTHRQYSLSLVRVMSAAKAVGYKVLTGTSG